MIRGGIVGGLYGNRGGGNNPVSYYFGKNQTKRVGQNYTPAGTGNSRPAEFKTTADEVYNGGKNNLLTITNGSDESDMDSTTARPNNAVLQFPVGRYDITFQGYSEDSFATSFRVELRQIQSGTDDLVLIETPGYSGAPLPARTEYLLSYPDFVIEGTEKFYFLFPVGGNDKRSHFLRVEKVG